MAANRQMSLSEIILDLRRLAFVHETCQNTRMAAFLGNTADNIEAAVLADSATIRRAVQDAIVGYQELYPAAPNDESENELKERAKIANDWLESHGWPREPVTWRKEKEPLI